MWKTSKLLRVQVQPSRSRPLSSGVLHKICQCSGISEDFQRQRIHHHLLKVTPQHPHTHIHIYIHWQKKNSVSHAKPEQLHFIRSEHFLTLIRPFGHAATHTLRYAQLSLAYPFYILSYSLLQLLLLLSFKVHQSFNIVWSQLLANISPPHPSLPNPPTSHHALHFPLPILPPLSFVILP